MEKNKSIALKRDNMFILDSSDYQVLSMLYKPLINHDALNIYSTLYMYSLNNDTVRLDSLSFKDMTADDNIKNELINEAIEKLSYVKLVMVSFDSITIYPPYDKYAFFNSPLANYLSIYTSKDHFSSLSNLFIKKELSVKTPLSTNLSGLKDSLKPFSKKKIVSTFDYKEFKDVVSSYLELSDDEEEFFKSIQYIYSFSLEEMTSLYYEALDNVFDKDKIISTAYKKYTNKLNKEKRIESKQTKDDDFINYFRSTKPEEIISNGKKISSSADSKILYRMRNELKLKEDIISLLVCYSLSTNDNKLHPYAYYLKIKEDWDKNGIQTVEDAYLYINSLYTNTSNKKLRESKDISSDEWFENFWKKAKEENNK